MCKGYIVWCVCVCARQHAHMHVYEVHMYVWCIYDIYAHVYEYIITQRQTPVSGVLYHCPPCFLKRISLNLELTRRSGPISWAGRAQAPVTLLC